MNTVTYLHIALEIWGAILCLTAAAVLFFAQRSVTSRLHGVIHIEVLNVLLLVSDVFARIYRGNTSLVGFYMVRISNFVVFIVGYLSLFVFTAYIKSFLSKESQRKWKPFFGMIYGASVGMILLLCLNLFTKWFYDFDAYNRYFRNDWFPLSQIVSALCLVSLGVFVFCLRRQLKKGFFIVIESYLVLPIVALIVQIFLYGFSLLNLAITIACLELFVVCYIDHVNQLKEQQNQLQEAQISLLMSRIQPHFLFNSLSTIRYLCKKDSQQAVNAIDVFSDYLRFNIDCMGAQECISFAQDLEHANNYLALEKKRFQEMLHIQIDTPYQNFAIPAMTLQPLVENAVRHGVRQKESEGNIWIRTRQEASHHVIEIEDDGAGFDVTQMGQDGKVHVGLENVRKRLELMCDGRLEIESTPGKGTICRIWIPMEA